MIAIILFPFAIIALWLAGISRLAKRSRLFRFVLLGILAVGIYHHVTDPKPVPTMEEQRAAKVDAILEYSYAALGWAPGALGRDSYHGIFPR